MEKEADAWFRVTRAMVKPAKTKMEKEKAASVSEAKRSGAN